MTERFGVIAAGVSVVSPLIGGSRLVVASSVVVVVVSAASRAAVIGVSRVVARCRLACEVRSSPSSSAPGRRRAFAVGFFRFRSLPVMVAPVWSPVAVIRCWMAAAISVAFMVAMLPLVLDVAVSTACVDGSSLSFTG
ncbi:hypothetical protein PF010_g25135 [Phytophthora fragariae]|uniref:Uncharacterized protein n=1 Tax=Phytophthora fragariae TaxID=53985 RepID=A0A6A3WES0_9STRA|nr:hypothetical protein PF010_g25135 [Phytophthora fragariae]KAE9183763.1 hypothetical protein PF002_g26619 [Phytophthora fragariae]